jgi:DNA-binding MarR family transcriptional regulator
MLTSTARAFGALYRRFQDSANQGYAARGWKGATLTHVQFLSDLEESGTRLSDVAAALQWSKQYAGKLARELVTRRLVTLEADPRDKRAVLARPTERGRAFLQDACAVRAALEADFLGKLPAGRRGEWVAALKVMVGG